MHELMSWKRTKIKHFSSVSGWWSLMNNSEQTSYRNRFPRTECDGNHSMEIIATRLKAEPAGVYPKAVIHLHFVVYLQFPHSFLKSRRYSRLRGQEEIILGWTNFRFIVDSFILKWDSSWGVFSVCEYSHHHCRPYCVDGKCQIMMTHLLPSNWILPPLPANTPTSKPKRTHISVVCGPAIHKIFAKLLRIYEVTSILLICNKF